MHLWWTDISSECLLILLKQMIDKKKFKCKINSKIEALKLKPK